MSRTDIFMSYQPKGNRRPKNLRDNCREFAEEEYKEEPDQGGDHAITNRRFGRGASGESST
jgi:hypothetical protein